jgi:hypothetical protein
MACEVFPLLKGISLVACRDVCSLDYDNKHYVTIAEAPHNDAATN